MFVFESQCKQTLKQIFVCITGINIFNDHNNWQHPIARCYKTHLNRLRNISWIMTIMFNLTLILLINYLKMDDLFWCNLCILCLLIMKVISCIWKSKNRDCIKNKKLSSLLRISCIVCQISFCSSIVCDIITNKHIEFTIC